MISELKRRQKRRARPIRAKALPHWLRAALLVEFGSVNAARTAAGLASIREEGIPPSRIIPEIKKRHAKRLSLAYTHAPRLLVSAAVARFGSWQSALEAAGLEYAEHRLKVKRHSDEHLIGWLRALAKAQPTLTLVEFMKTRCNAREN